VQKILSSEFKCGHLLRFDKVFNENTTYDKFEVCKLRVSDFLSYVFALLFLVCFHHSCFVFYACRC
jgi:hypothetical protein